MKAGEKNADRDQRRMRHMTKQEILAAAMRQSAIDCCCAEEDFRRDTHIVAENRSENGRPLMDNRTINTLSGFVKCGDADHAFSGMASENDMINAFMKNGFYYE